MAISTGNLILGSDVGYTSGTTATAAGMNSKFGSSVSVGTLIQPISSFNTRYLIQNGKFVSGIGHQAVGSIWQNWTTQSDHIWLTTYTGGSNDYLGGNLTPAINFSGQWKHLVVDSRMTGDTSYIGLSTNSNAKDLNFSKRFTWFSRRSGLTGRATQRFDITGATGNLYVAVRLKSWIYVDGNGSASGSGGDVRIYNLYLTRD